MFHLGFRWLNDAQRALCAARLVNFTGGRPTGDTVTSKQAGAALNISAKQVQRARRVLKHGSPEVIAKVEHGLMTISAAEEKSAPVINPRKRYGPQQPCATTTHDRAADNSEHGQFNTAIVELSELIGKIAGWPRFAAAMPIERRKALALELARALALISDKAERSSTGNALAS